MGAGQRALSGPVRSMSRVCSSLSSQRAIGRCMTMFLVQLEFAGSAYPLFVVYGSKNNEEAIMKVCGDVCVCACVCDSETRLLLILFCSL